MTLRIPRVFEGFTTHDASWLLVFRAFASRRPSIRLADEKALYLEVTAAGGKYWRWKYRHGGKEKRLALGVYPDVSLAQAREARDDARKLLKDGTDPGQLRREAKAAG